MSDKERQLQQALRLLRDARSMVDGSHGGGESRKALAAIAAAEDAVGRALRSAKGRSGSLAPSFGSYINLLIADGRLGEPVDLSELNDTGRLMVRERAKAMIDEIDEMSAVDAER